MPPLKLYSNSLIGKNPQLFSFQQLTIQAKISERNTNMKKQ